MTSDASLRFFARQFQRQARDGDQGLNPFEQRALPYLRGRVLDYGCGLGNLALEAARRGCPVVALDGSPTAIARLRAAAGAAGLPVEAAVADLRSAPIAGAFDTVVSIGLLMFFDCPTAMAKLGELQAHLRPGGVAVVNVLEQGTTYLDMFDPAGCCLFAPGELERRFGGWEILSAAHEDFPAPGGQVKRFATLIAKKPREAAHPDGAVM
ncbi:MAG TPA: methyltransferase domain-containing protein [Ramlibacter sp.]